MTLLEIVLVFLFGGSVGFCIAWFVKSKELQLERKNALEQGKNSDELENKFKALASDVLRLNSKDFLQLAQKDLDKTKALVSADLSNKEKGFERLVDSVNKSVDSIEKKVNQFEKERGEQYGALGASIKQVLETGEQINRDTNKLTTALTSSITIRGRWGETVLRNVLEDSGLTEGIDFFVQETILGDESSSLRPDIIINLPGDLRLVIDSKASLEEFFKATEEQKPELKTEHIGKFVAHIKSIVKKLSSKEYQRHLDSKIPYVIMFIPSEPAARAALEYDTSLWREGQTQRVLIASPVTIMPMALLIAHTWKQHKSSENVLKLGNEINDLGERLRVFFKHVAGIGTNLSQTTKKFNEAVSSWESRVSPKIEAINKLGGNIQSEVQIQSVEEQPRELDKPLALEKPLVEE